MHESSCATIRIDIHDSGRVEHLWPPYPSGISFYSERAKHPAASSAKSTMIQ